jgi:hypothetical protein
MCVAVGYIGPVSHSGGMEDEGKPLIQSMIQQQQLRSQHRKTYRIPVEQCSGRAASGNTIFRREVL